jgi:hypothetical protein
MGGVQVHPMDSCASSAMNKSINQGLTRSAASATVIVMRPPQHSHHDGC